MLQFIWKFINDNILVHQVFEAESTHDTQRCPPSGRPEIVLVGERRARLEGGRSVARSRGGAVA